MIAPPVVADADLRDFHFMPLDVARLGNSDLAAIATGEEFKAAVLLWCKCWHQVPASSLPNDDRMLAHLAGLGRDLKTWKKVKDIALRGFVLCDDGRLYHPVIAEKVNEALEAKRRQRERTVKATKSRQERPKGADEQRDVQRDDQRDVQRDDQRDVHQGTGTGTGTVIEDISASRARDPDDPIEARLREAAGWQSDPSPNLLVTGPIHGVIAAGANLELDVLPVVRSLAPRCRGRKNWNFFVPAIVEARDRRVAAATAVSTPSQFSGDIHGLRKPAARQSTVDTILETLGGGPKQGA